jgi:CRP-like cAMP-binding protein
MAIGEVLYAPEVAQSHVYFPTTAIVSLLDVLENGDTAEIAIVGNEGIAGISLIMGGASTPTRAVIISTGGLFRLNREIVEAEFLKAGPVLHLFLRYVQALITQIAQNAVCNRHHSLDQQLCRRLLLILDRLQSHDLIMTQESIAYVLGVSRERVSGGAAKLLQAGLVRYTRGRITVLDREGLQKRCCECYRVVKKEYNRLLPRTIRQLSGS